MDIMSPADRSERMRRIKSSNTGPERKVRSVVHAMGYRYRLHRRDLPGNPDLVFPSRKKIILVHGCLWHSHEGCRLNRPPKSRSEYWVPKLRKNKSRDTENMARLIELGWSVLVLWECEIEKPHDIEERIQVFLGPRVQTG